MPIEKLSGDGIHLGYTVSTRSQVLGLGPLVSALCISYPKSGRTWLRFMIGDYLRRESDPKLPMAFMHDGADGGDAMGDNDYPFESRRWCSAYPVVILVRDPRDIAVSNYFQITKRDRPFGHDRFREFRHDSSMSEFIRRADCGIENIITFYNFWLELVHRVLSNGRTLLVSYEEMTLDPEGTLARVLTFLGISIKPPRVSAVVIANAFEQLRLRERERPTPSEILRPGDPTDLSSFKTRRGKMAGYRDELGLSDIAFMDRRINETLRPEALRARYCHEASLSDPVVVRFPG